MSVYDPSETWNQKREGDLEAMNDPEAADDPEADGGRPRGHEQPRGGAADLEVLGVKATHKFRGVKARRTQVSWLRRTKTRPSGTWNQKVEDDLEAVNDPEALDDLKAVEDDLEAVNDPEEVGDPKAVADPIAVLDDPGVARDNIWRRFFGHG
nr:hypothetical protein Iba_chr15bCG9740 [Ipomoea batatas]